MTAKPWLAHYDPGVPHTLEPYPNRTLFDLVAGNARERPDHAAVYFKGTWMTWSQLDHLSDVFATALAEKGLKKGQRVALLMPNGTTSTRPLLVE